MDGAILRQAIEYTFATIVGAGITVAVAALLYQKIVIDDNDSWKFWTSFFVAFIFLTAIYYLLIYKGVL